MAEKKKEQNVVNLLIAISSLMLVLLVVVWAFTSTDLFIYTKTEVEIEQDIESLLLVDTRVNPDNIMVDVDGTEVTLSGNVANYTAYLASAEIAQRVVGVEFVENNLLIENITRVLSDSELEDVINERYIYDSDLEVFDITVNVEESMATLTGNVDALWKKYEAERLAFNVVGIVGVDNLLAVVPTEDVDDEMIARTIVQTIENNLFLNEQNIDVIVEDNVVTISGNVDTLYEYNEVTDIASFTLGVVEVNNELLIY